MVLRTSRASVLRRSALCLAAAIYVFTPSPSNLIRASSR